MMLDKELWKEKLTELYPRNSEEPQSEGEGDAFPVPQAPIGNGA